MIARAIRFCLLAVALSAAPASADPAPTKALEVWKSPNCGCCSAWIEHMQREGFSVKSNDLASGLLAQIKQQAGLAPEHHACHTAKIGGYVVEGHVPAEDVKRLLAERPDAVGLAVPGMPLGSPGMDAGGEQEPYEVLLLKKDGATEVFARH